MPPENLGIASTKISPPLCIYWYGILADLVDDHLEMGESQVIKCVNKGFVVQISIVFGEVYLRAPNSQDTTRLLEFNNNREFPGMLGSIVCMHLS
jgi:hypothetical protein